jgi:peroxiredoxin
MKTRNFSMCLSVLCIFVAHSYAQNAQFTINGKLQDVSPMPAKMYMSSLVKGILKPDKDSVDVKNGEYHFKGEININEAVGVLISTDGKEAGTNGFAVYLDRGELDIVSKGSLKQITVSGSASEAQKQHEDIIKGIDKEKEELKIIVASDAYKTSQELQADVLKRSRALSVKGLIDLYTYVKNNPDKRSSPFSTYALVSSGFVSAQGQDTLLQSLPAHVKADRLGQEIAHVQIRRDSLIKASQVKNEANLGKVPVGTKAPDFTQYDVKNNPVALSSFRGKYVLVDFWASWCMPCRAENPNVVRAYNKYKDKGFTVLGVSLDSESGRPAWLKAIASDGLIWTQVSDLKGWKNQAADMYGVSSIPQNFLIDPNGVVVGKNLRGEDLNTKLASIFK